jgi:hypothetical protein
MSRFIKIYPQLPNQNIASSIVASVGSAASQMQEPVHHFQIDLKQHLLLHGTVWPVEVGLIDIDGVWWRQSQRRMRRLRLREVWWEVTW